MNRTSIYASDEDISLRAPGDFLLLCPRDQKLASGVDGRFLATDRWTLQSDGVNFEESGFTAGCVVLLSKPAVEFKAGGELFAVETVSGHSLGLRRKGESVGRGRPPAPPSGLVGVEFLALTLRPQLELMSDDLDRRLGLSPNSDALDDPDELREPTVLGVLYKLYLDVSRETGQGKSQIDGFAGKARLLKQEFDEVLARLAVHRRDSSRGGSLTTRFHTRISR